MCNNTVISENGVTAGAPKLVEAIVRYYDVVKGKSSKGGKTRFTDWFRYHTELGYQYPTRGKDMDEEYVIEGTKRAMANEICVLAHLDKDTYFHTVKMLISSLVEKDYRSILMNNQSWVTNYEGPVLDSIPTQGTTETVIEVEVDNE